MSKQKSSRKVVLFITIPLFILLVSLSVVFFVRQTGYTSVFYGKTMSECDDYIVTKKADGFTCEINDYSGQYVCKAICKKSDETEVPEGWYRCKSGGKLEQYHNGEWTPYRYCDYYNNKIKQCKYADTKYSSTHYTLCEDKKIIERYFCYQGECLSYEKYQNLWISDYTIHSTSSSCRADCGEQEPTTGKCTKEYVGDSYCKTDGNVYKKEKQTDCSVKEVLVDTCSDNEYCKDGGCVLIEDKLPEEEQEELEEQEQTEEYIAQFTKVCHPMTGEEGDIYWMDSNGETTELVLDCEGECQYDNDGEPECLTEQGGQQDSEELEEEIIEEIKEEFEEFEVDKITLSIIIVIIVVIIIASIFYFKKPNKKKKRKRRR